MKLDYVYHKRVEMWEAIFCRPEMLSAIDKNSLVARVEGYLGIIVQELFGE